MNVELQNSIFLVPCLPAGKGSFGIPRVRMIGVEPTCLTAPDPKSGASANFATSAAIAPASIMVEADPLWKL